MSHPLSKKAIQIVKGAATIDRKVISRLQKEAPHPTGRIYNRIGNTVLAVDITTTSAEHIYQMLVVEVLNGATEWPAEMVAPAMVVMS